MRELSRFGRIKKIHFIGIGGSGMGGIAEVLHNLGYTVSGSDQAVSAMTKRLSDVGISVFIGHDAKWVENADAIVISTAIASDNPELICAREARIPVVRRAEMLAELMRFRYGIAVAGSHGKTTTTSLITSVFREAGLDPTFVIGGLLNSAGVNASLGGGKYLIAEADESDASFLYLQPMLSVITNIDNDHLTNYNNDFNQLKEAFIQFLHHLPFYGRAVLCRDDEVINELLPRIARPVLTYGFHPEADFRGENFKQQGRRITFTVVRPAPHLPLEVEVNLPGMHTALNALATIAVATDENLADEAILRGLKEFQGIGRRMQWMGDFALPTGNIRVIDDYGHHPKEILATIRALKASWPEKRLIMIFQPHRFTRTHDLFEDFVHVLNEVDILLLMDVYSAGETPIAGADSKTLARNIRQRGKLDPIFVGDIKEIPEVLLNIANTNDLVITQGAGNVGALSHWLCDEMFAKYRDAHVTSLA